MWKEGEAPHTAGEEYQKGGDWRSNVFQFEKEKYEWAKASKYCDFEKWDTLRRQTFPFDTTAKLRFVQRTRFHFSRVQ